MLYQLRKKINTWRFDWQIGGIVTTFLLRSMPAGWTIVSMVAPCDTLDVFADLEATLSNTGAGMWWRSSIAICRKIARIYRVSIYRLLKLSFERTSTRAFASGVAPGSDWYTCWIGR
jgi:hypothetical protein